MNVAVIGGGIAGMAVAHFLAPHARVVLLEQESSLAYHSTGRSAAQYFENYGVGPVRPLTRASRGFLEAPPTGLVEGPLMAPRAALIVGRPDQRATLEATLAEGRTMNPSIAWLEPEDARRLCPALRPDRLLGAVLEPEAMDIDVAGLHQAFVRGMRREGGTILPSSPVTVIDRNAGGHWTLRAGNQLVEADVVVNAAGAWGDRVALLAGVAPVGLRPLRRTAFMVPGRSDARDWPLVVDADHDFYFKPDGSQFLCSPADETPSEPVDARPEEIDIALAIERINAATDLAIRTVRSAWAGLRTFAPDDAPVIGFEADVPGFFWLVGQGGTGIQTAPAAGQLAAALILGRDVPAELRRFGVEPEPLAPGRLRS